MDKFVKKDTKHKKYNKSHAPVNITAADCAKTYKFFHEDGGKLFCTPCNKVIDHIR